MKSNDRLALFGTPRRQAKKAPTLRLRLAAPQGGAFCLGAVRRQKKSPHAAPSACCPPRGCFLPWGGPAAKKNPAVRATRNSPGGHGAGLVSSMGPAWSPWRPDRERRSGRHGLGGIGFHRRA